jgi:hypothetical protein
MRNRHLPQRLNPEPSHDSLSFSNLDRAVPLARIFAPSDLDLDDLAEAIRFLLEPANSPRIGPSRRPKPELLSLPRRGSHVVEATETL